MNPKIASSSWVVHSLDMKQLGASLISSKWLVHSLYIKQLGGSTHFVARFWVVPLTVC